MSPDFRHASSAPFGDSPGDDERSPADYSRFRFTNTGRRKLRGKKKAAPSGLHKRHNKRVGW